MNGAGDKKSSGKASEISAYCAFKDDRNRLWALISRDVRLVFIAVIAVVGLHYAPLFSTRELLAMLGLSG